MDDYAWQRYNLYTAADGSISGTTATNDNNDDGYPDKEGIERWHVSYRDRADMIRRTGGSHTGCSGVEVTVFLDGQLVTK